MLTLTKFIIYEISNSILTVKRRRVAWDFGAIKWQEACGIWRESAIEEVSGIARGFVLHLFDPLV
jgi:hypothetical protein